MPAAGIAGPAAASETPERQCRSLLPVAKSFGETFRVDDGVARDAALAACARAVRAQPGNAVLNHLYGWALIAFDENFAKAGPYLRKAAEQGHPNAQALFGWVGEETAIPPDYREAVEWYRRAADHGDMIGQFFLALKYLHGRGVPKDYETAIRWFRASAEQGSEPSRSFLGTLIGSDAVHRAAPKDPVEAHMWFNLAAANSRYASFGRAAKQRDEISARMTPAQIVEAQRLARQRFRERAALGNLRATAKAGDAGAQYALAQALLKGEGVPQDYLRAYKWFNLAAARAGTAAERARAAEGRRDAAAWLTPAHIREAQRLSREWAPPAPAASD